MECGFTEQTQLSHFPLQVYLLQQKRLQARTVGTANVTSTCRE